MSAIKSITMQEVPESHRNAARKFHEATKHIDIPSLLAELEKIGVSAQYIDAIKRGMAGMEELMEQA